MQLVGVRDLADAFGLGIDVTPVSNASTACTVEVGMFSFVAMGTGPRRCFQRGWTILRTTGAGVLACWVWRAEGRSTIPAVPSSRYRWDHFAAVRHETLKNSAAREGGQPSSTISRARRSQCFGVRAALA